MTATKDIAGSIRERLTEIDDESRKLRSALGILERATLYRKDEGAYPPPSKRGRGRPPGSKTRKRTPNKMMVGAK